VKIAQQVENLLQASRAARNSDKELLVLYMQRAGMELTEKQIQLFRQLPSMETIRRIRQKLQENGQYLADQLVEDQRYDKYVNVRASVADPTVSIEVLLEGSGERIVAAPKAISWLKED
jgi:hypothetical protein